MAGKNNGKNSASQGRQAKRTAQKKEITIILLGVTGAGKTTFVSLASGRNDLRIGHGVDPCTQDPDAITFPFPTDGRLVTLIDTPGFDDDKRSDVQILEDIARWLARRAQAKKQLVDGIIFLHPITLNRVGGSERNRTRLLEKILGPDAYNRVFIATTMWDDLVETGDAAATTEVRLQGRIVEGGVWHDLRSRGATILKHNNNKESAIKIIQRIIDAAEQAPKVEPLLQTELRTKNGRVIETAAGKELETQLMNDVRVLRLQLSEHEKDRPPESYRKHVDRSLRREWKDWHKNREYMEGRLVAQEQQLKKLGGLIVRIRLWFTGFGRK